VRAKAARKALRALTEVPGGATVARLLQRLATNGQLAGAGGIKRVLGTIGSGGRTLDAHLQDALHIALAARPTEAPQLQKTLSSLAILRTLSTQSHLGCEWDPLLHRDEVVAIAHTITTVSHPLAELEATVLELRRAGLIVTRGAKDAQADLSWDAIGPYHFFFCRTDALFQHWDPEADAKEICRRSRQTRVVNSAALDTDLRWGPRRLNSAATYAQLRHWITVPYRHASGDQYVLPCAYLTEEGRRSAAT
jgi:hypothetical protein